MPLDCMIRRLDIRNGMYSKRLLLFDGCNYRSLLFSNPLFRGLFHF